MGKPIIVSRVEHEALRQTCRQLERSFDSIYAGKRFKTIYNGKDYSFECFSTNCSTDGLELIEDRGGNFDPLRSHRLINCIEIK